MPKSIQFTIAHIRIINEEKAIPPPVSIRGLTYTSFRWAQKTKLQKSETSKTIIRTPNTINKH